MILFFLLPFCLTTHLKRGLCTQADPNNLFRLIEFADALRLFDVQYHDGGSSQKEAISSYKEAIALALKEREKKVELDEETNRSLSGTVNIPDEIMLSYNYMSTDGILCSLYTSIGKVYFMANMFENAVKSYTEALGIEPLYLDALAARGVSLKYTRMSRSCCSCSTIFLCVTDTSLCVQLFLLLLFIQSHLGSYLENSKMPQKILQLLWRKTKKDGS